MTEEEWLTATTPAGIIDHLRYATPRKRRLFCVACCRRIMSLNHNPIVREALVIAERFADGWERREALVNAAEQVNGPRVKLGWFYRSPTTITAEAVAAVCQIGTELNPELILRCISDASGRDSPEDVAGGTAQCELIRDIFGNPFRPVTFSPEWRTDTAVSLARTMYESREFGAMPILADALQDAGCENDDILNHCRDANQVHVRGCWVVDLVLGKA